MSKRVLISDKDVLENVQAWDDAGFDPAIQVRCALREFYGTKAPGDRTIARKLLVEQSNEAMVNLVTKDAPDMNDVLKGL